MLKQAIQRAAAVAGVAIRKVPKPSKAALASNLSHSAVMPYASYSPWLDDPEFQRINQAIRGHTLVDPLRCYELWDLVRQAAQLPGDVLEVGVWRGGTGALLCKRVPNKTVYLADTFKGVVGATEHDPDYVGGEHADTSEETVKGLLQTLGVENARILVGIYPDDFPPIGALCFVHLDVDVYGSSKNILEAVWPALSPGGMVVFDDYGFPTTTGVTTLVNEYRGRPDRTVLYNLNGHAVMIKR